MDIVSFSGGKDSTAMLLMMIEKKMPIDEVVFADTGLEFLEMYEYIDKIENTIKQKITRIKPPKTFEELFYRKRCSGKAKGQIQGWPMTIGAWCNDRLKVNPLKKYFKSAGEHTSYIGITADESKRYNRLLHINNKAPLYKWGITGNQAKKYLIERDLLNPLYKKFDRLGCYLCPKQCMKSLKVIYNDYPEKWAYMLKLDRDSPVTFKPNMTLHQIDNRFKSEDWWQENQIEFEGIER